MRAILQLCMHIQLFLDSGQVFKYLFLKLAWIDILSQNAKNLDTTVS